ncbi:MAG TPA: hypothetical protein VKZ59_00260, partial [Acidobacteriota bacterium]|nr:hypothetical protein [Acidobacteriota bacterium]
MRRNLVVRSVSFLLILLIGTFTTAQAVELVRPVETRSLHEHADSQPSGDAEYQCSTSVSGQHHCLHVQQIFTQIPLGQLASFEKTIAQFIFPVLVFSQASVHLPGL